MAPEKKMASPLHVYEMTCSELCGRRSSRANTSPTSHSRALSSLTRLLALLKNTSEVPNRRVAKTGIFFISQASLILDACTRMGKYSCHSQVSREGNKSTLIFGVHLNTVGPLKQSSAKFLKQCSRLIRRIATFFGSLLCECFIYGTALG